MAIELTEYEDEVFITGGGAIYSAFLPFTKTVYLTVVKKEMQGNIYFPELSDDFTEVFSEDHSGVIPYVYKTYKRN